MITAPTLITTPDGEIVGYIDVLDNDDRAASLAKTIIEAVIFEGELGEVRSTILTNLLSTELTIGEALSVAMGALLRLSAALAESEGRVSDR